ncbi:MAG: SDR family oxidoreductase, partial [Lachnospiraceae bacterium]|nr:SDR family oxidoreductase [Lachnospiraceae bacterium]
MSSPQSETARRIRFQGGENALVYNAAKAAIRSMARSFAGELARRGIRANAISPGPTNTKGFSGYSACCRLFHILLVIHVGHIFIVVILFGLVGVIEIVFFLVLCLVVTKITEINAVHRRLLRILSVYRDDQRVIRHIKSDGIVVITEVQSLGAGHLRRTVDHGCP